MSHRDLLLQNALSLFSARGYDAVGVQEICDAAAVQKPTLYHFFGSKAGLLDALLAEQFTPLFSALEQNAVYRHDVKNALEAVARTYFDFASNNTVFYRLQLALWFCPPQSEPFKAVAPYNLRQQNFLEDLFTQAALDHGNMKGRHKAYAAAFLGTVNTYAALGLNGFTTLDAPLTYQVVHQFMHGIFS